MHKSVMHIAAMALTLAAGTTIASAPAAAGWQDFGLVNASNLAVYHVYVSASDLDDWGPDQLGRDVLMPGEVLSLGFPDVENRCFFDVKVVDENGYDSVLWNQNLCATTTITYQ